MLTAVDPSTFREGMSRLAGAVNVVATGPAAGGTAQRRGMTATAVCSVCAEPPSLLVCLHRGAGTATDVLRFDMFSVNVLNEHHVDVAQTFSDSERHGADRFSVGTWERGRIGVPVLADALVSFECQVADAHNHGTHTLIIGTIESVRWSPDVEPLVFHARRFVGLSEQPLAETPRRTA